MQFSIKHSQLKAGDYNVSPKMSAYNIATKIAQGDVIKDKVVILESSESDICIKGSSYKIIKWDIKEEVSIEGFPVFDIMESGELYVDLTEEEMNEWLIKKQLPVF
jgi:cell division protein YceG involved in septum cleavage